MQVDSTGASMTDSLAGVSRNPEHAQLLSEHRRLEKGRKELENQVNLGYILGLRQSHCLLHRLALHALMITLDLIPILSPWDIENGLMVAYLKLSIALMLSFPPQAEWLVH